MTRPAAAPVPGGRCDAAPSFLDLYRKMARDYGLAAVRPTNRR